MPAVLSDAWSGPAIEAATNEIGGASFWNRQMMNDVNNLLPPNQHRYIRAVVTLCYVPADIYISCRVLLLRCVRNLISSPSRRRHQRLVK